MFFRLLHFLSIIRVQVLPCTKLCVFANTGTKLCVFANTGTVFIYLGPIQLRQVQHTKVLSSTEESQST